MSVELWMTFVAASGLLLLIPGPTILLVLSYALSQGRSVALATAGGVALGDLIAMTASLAGLGLLVMTSATLFTVLKWAGAVYLVYLGIMLFRQAPDTARQLGLKARQLGDDGRAAPAGVRASRVFLHAAVVTALNPKSIAFFIAFVPQFIHADSAFLPQAAVLTGTFVGLAALNALAYALLAVRLRQRISRPTVMAGLCRAGGLALVAMGVATASLRRATA